MPALRLLASSAAMLLLAGCGERATLPIAAGYGASPTLPSPRKTLLPTLNTARAVGWKPGEAPTPRPGLQVAAFAEGLDHPRWLLALPNGDVLVAETNAPPKPKDGAGPRGWVQTFVMKGAGAVTKSADRITLLRDADGDGRAEVRRVFLADLHSPFGMTLAGGRLYVADTDAVVSVPYATGDLQAREALTKLVDLPAGEINHHWTKNVIASQDGSKLYVTVGSNSNVGDKGLAEEAGRAAIWEVDVATGAHREFATGLRNPNGMFWAPGTGALWAAVNERDEIGSDLVPDYMTSVKDGGFYGWPFSYYGQTVDARVKAQRPDLVARAIKPDYALGPHTASLGLAYGAAPGLAEGAYVGQHGSWNRKPASGYKVLFVPFTGGRPSGEPQDVLTGFLDAEGHARGRPVGVVFDGRGGLLVADDVGNRVWRVTEAPARAVARR